jgi:hypothetical protein
VSAPIDPRDPFGEHGEWDALAVGWALSALDPEDEERFAEHLPGCARCTATVRESLYTVADLAYALPDEAPPPSLKSRLMTAVAAEPRTPGTAPEHEVPVVAEPEEEWPLGEPHPGSPGYGIDWFAKAQRSTETPGDRTPGEGGSGAAPVDGAVDPTAEARADARPAGDEVGAQPSAGGDARRLAGADRDDRAAGDEVEALPAAGYRGGDLDQGARTEPADVVSLASRRRRLTRRVGIGVAAAAVLALIAGLLAWNVDLRNEQRDLRQVVAQRDAAIHELTANSPARVAALTADGKPSPQRQATLVVRGDQIEIITESLGATTGDETYWLWTLRCDTPQPTDLKPIRGFTVAQSEFSVRDIGSDPGVASAPCFAISSELGSATPKAPRQVVAVGQAE